MVRILSTSTSNVRSSTRTHFLLSGHAMTLQKMILSPPSRSMIQWLSVLVLLLPTCLGMQIHRHWTTQHWCDSVINPQWPQAYAKYVGQPMEETKGRVSSNRQDVRHECDRRGVRSKCHLCEEIACGAQINQTCGQFQLQGVSWRELSSNIATVTDVPWAVNGSHRYDFGGSTTTHVCMYLSSTSPCQSSFGTDYSKCELRCWGYGLSGVNNTVVYSTNDGEPDGIWPNHQFDSFRGVNSTPWEEPLPTTTWEYPRTSLENDTPQNPLFNPQGDRKSVV